MVLRFFISADHLIVLYFCTKFAKISECVFRVINTISILKYLKGHNSMKNAEGVMLLVLFTLSDDASYLYQLS